jgi:hypothetical protein
MTITQTQSITIQRPGEHALRRLFSVDEFHHMAQRGIFQESDRLELIKGEIITMSPISARHAHSVRQLIRIFNQSFSDRAILDVQNPVVLGEHSEPQPDAMLLKTRADLYKSHPTPEDVLLLVEVADSSLAYDRDVKGPLYARAGVLELWIVNVVDARLEVYRDPTPQGYRTRRWLWPGDAIAPFAFPDTLCQVEDILG